MDSLAPAIITDNFGVLLRRDAVAMGVDDKALARLVGAGVLLRMRQGVYCRQDTFMAAGDRDRALILIHAVMRLYGEHVALSHGSACAVQGGPDYGLSLHAVDLTHLSGSGRQRSRIRHHHGECRVGDLRRHNGYWLTTPARSVADTACTNGVVAGLVQANHFLHAGLTSREELRAMVERATNWPGSLRHHPVLLLADERIESVGETLSDHLFFTQGLPRATPQYVIDDPDRGQSYRVDFAWPERRVIVEFDGAEKYHRHRKPGESIEQMVMREKHREDRIRELTGWTVIRITWRDLRFPAHTSHRIRDKFVPRSTFSVDLASGL